MSDFSIDNIIDASTQIKDVAVRTPLIENMHLNEYVGGRVFLKCENFQHTGSFKFRGAYNRLSRLSDDAKQAGVLAFSSGNHAQGVAYAAQLLGIKATIIMPQDAPQLKIEGTKKLGADVIFYDRYNEDREEVALKFAGNSNVTIVPPYNDLDIMAGQGTVGLEIAEDMKAAGLEPDQALINCGGGGLCSGAFTALKHTFRDMSAYAVEAEEFDDVTRSLESGVIEKVNFGARSICDALLTPSAGELTFPVLQKLSVNGLTITDNEAKTAVSFALRKLKLIAEPGGCASLAAILAGKVETKNKITVCVISGGNIDPDVLTDYLEY